MHLNKFIKLLLFLSMLGSAYSNSTEFHVYGAEEIIQFPIEGDGSVNAFRPSPLFIGMVLNYPNVPEGAILVYKESVFGPLFQYSQKAQSQFQQYGLKEIPLSLYIVRNSGPGYSVYRINPEFTISNSEYKVVLSELKNNKIIIEKIILIEDGTDDAICKFVANCDDCKSTKETIKIKFINELPGRVEIDVYANEQYLLSSVIKDENNRNKLKDDDNKFILSKNISEEYQIRKCKYAFLSFKYRINGVGKDVFHDLPLECLKRDCLVRLDAKTYSLDEDLVEIIGVTGNSKEISYYNQHGDLQKVTLGSENLFSITTKSPKQLTINDKPFKVINRDGKSSAHAIKSPKMIIIDFNYLLDNNTQFNKKKNDDFIEIVNNMLKETENSNVHLYKYLNFYPRSKDSFRKNSIESVNFKNYLTPITVSNYTEFKEQEKNDTIRVNVGYKSKFWVLEPLVKFDNSHLFSTSQDEKMENESYSEEIISNINSFEWSTKYDDIYVITYNPMRFTSGSINFMHVRKNQNQLIAKLKEFIKRD